jgi:hypothetical protein
VQDEPQSYLICKGGHALSEASRDKRGRFAALVLIVTLAAASKGSAAASDDFAPIARAMRQKALERFSGPPVLAPAKGLALGPAQHPLLLGLLSFSRYPWHLSVEASCFWVGEPARPGDPGNLRSAWDPDWLHSYGGVDAPNRRSAFCPAAFIPKLNPFYVALPVTDVLSGHTVPEAAAWIPWFKEAFTRDGVSVLKDRWVAIKHNGRTCYAQLEDVGPYYTDCWSYVFGADLPRPHPNNAAGIDVSPAVRDYLELNGEDVTDWRFVSTPPPGPWLNFGESTTLARR